MAVTNDAWKVTQKKKEFETDKLKIKILIFVSFFIMALYKILF